MADQDVFATPRHVADVGECDFYHTQEVPGVGVVRDSDPAAELAETDVKLQALLPVLSG